MRLLPLPWPLDQPRGLSEQRLPGLGWEKAKTSPRGRALRPPQPLCCVWSWVTSEPFSLICRMGFCTCPLRDLGQFS